MDIVAFNRAWLGAWTSKSVEAVLSFYHADIRFYDEFAPDGVFGHAALGALLEGLFASTPPWVMQPEIVWPIEGGFCGRWYMDMGTGADAVRLRGFDQVQLEGGLIIHNEVYTHKLAGAAQAG